MKQLVDFPNYYITTEGIVINKKNHIIKPFINNKGYVLVRLWNNNKSVSKLVHRLVAETFIPKIEGKCEVNHIDGDKTNNNVNNLEWCTRQENNLHAKLLGAKQYSSEFRGIKIAQYDINNTLIKVYPSLREAGKAVNGNHGNIKKACETNRIYHNYLWKYYEGVETK